MRTCASRNPAGLPDGSRGSPPVTPGAAAMVSCTLEGCQRGARSSMRRGLAPLWGACTASTLIRGSRCAPTPGYLLAPRSGVRRREESLETASGARPYHCWRDAAEYAGERLLSWPASPQVPAQDGVGHFLFGGTPGI